MPIIVIAILMSSPGRLLRPLPTGSPGHEGLRKVEARSEELYKVPATYGTDSNFVGWL